ncbi:YtxH domain-containing protein [Hymenobacter sp. BT175]|uniref:YtxH domain-containing protein n=1 Tax=Hymenobacter translucens TaxID=2886507 RepID=UPI001D0E42FF|nr:YtxH domain-containing protein [Hymenobacter translucens]MCC2547833.1 YtxH domain-containing protein [Hymenobacter translucens]
MKDNNGKVILSLLAGAAAGVVAGLLLAPETGEETRKGLKKSSSKWTDELGKLLKDGLAKFSEMQAGGAGTGGSADQDRSAADDLLNSMASSEQTTDADTGANDTGVAGKSAAKPRGGRKSAAAGNDAAGPDSGMDGGDAISGSGDTAYGRSL